MSSANTIAWRKRTKERLVLGFGGKCNKCGYNKCLQGNCLNLLIEKYIFVILVNR